MKASISVGTRINFNQIVQVRHVKRAFVTKLKDDWILLTEGINVEKMWDMNNLVDIQKLACNNIHVMAK